jgi:predicted PurR-regulated permease PerM
MEILFGVAAVSGAVMGGVNSAQSYCAYQSQQKAVINQIANINDKSSTLLNELDQEDQQLQNEIQSLQTSALASSNTLVQLRKQYVTQLEKYQLIAVMYIVIVFMLLTAKKMKLF